MSSRPRHRFPCQVSGGEVDLVLRVNAVLSTLLFIRYVMAEQLVNYVTKFNSYSSFNNSIPIFMLSTAGGGAFASAGRVLVGASNAAHRASAHLGIDSADATQGDRPPVPVYVGSPSYSQYRRLHCPVFSALPMNWLHTGVLHRFTKKGTPTCFAY